MRFIQIVILEKKKSHNCDFFYNDKSLFWKASVPTMIKISAMIKRTKAFMMAVFCIMTKCLGSNKVSGVKYFKNSTLSLTCDNI